MVGNMVVWMVIKSTFLTMTHKTPGDPGPAYVLDVTSCLLSSLFSLSTGLPVVPHTLCSSHLGLWNSLLHAFFLLMKAIVNRALFRETSLIFLSTWPHLSQFISSLPCFIFFLVLALVYASVYRFIILLFYHNVSSMRAPICFICCSTHSTYHGRAQHTVGAQEMDAE